MNLRRLTAVAAIGGLACISASTMPQVANAAPAKPKNVIVMIGDGMGYNHVNNASLYEFGQSYKQVVGEAGKVVEQEGVASYSYQKFPVQVDMQTYSDGGSYDASKAWNDFAYVKDNPTDSAAAGTAMATGVKTYNAGLGVDADKNPVENIGERALAQGKAAGSISSVNYWHATPASYVVHNENRNNRLAITNQEINSDFTVIMGAGHPGYGESGQKLAANDYTYNIAESDFTDLQNGKDSWKLVEDKAGFEALTTGDTPARVFGMAPVKSTLQQGRAGTSTKPYDVPFTSTVPSLETMTKGALNVLDNDPDGFMLMVEGGAIDWAGHANQTARNIEEVMEFNKAIDAVNAWVETNSSWDETLVIVTADHETGYLEGAGANPGWTSMTGGKGENPGLSWNSGDHTNMLVPVYAKGAGADLIAARATMIDPVRGAYLDNTVLAKVVLEDYWPAAVEPTVTVTDPATTVSVPGATVTATETVHATVTPTVTATATTTATTTVTATVTATVNATQTVTAPAETVTLPGTTTTVTVTPPPSISMPVLKAPYEVPGFHTINGRQWYTSCEPYSQTIRCRTDIWSKRVVLENGKFVMKSGYNFNNLTYLPFLTKPEWGTNPLANTGEWTTPADGRKYKTECATDGLTCRSYIWGKVVKASGSSYTLVDQWVVNNLVSFKTA